MNIYEQAAKNKRDTRVILAVFTLLFLLIGIGFDYFYGAGIPLFTGIAIAAAALSSFGGYMCGDRLILSSTHARELNLDDPKEKQWQNVVEEVSIAAGLPLPKTYVIDDLDPNAFATGRDPRHSSIAVTSGLLDALSRDELQAVTAHEMSHVRNFDIRLMLIVGVLVGSVALLADWAGRSLFWGRRRREGSGGEKSGGSGTLILLVIWLIAMIIAPILSQLIAMCVSRKREYLADASGAELTRNPIALANALEKINSYTKPTRSINRGTAHLCIIDPKGSALGAKEGWAADLFATHPPIQKRIAALKQMAYER